MENFVSGPLKYKTDFKKIILLKVAKTSIRLSNSLFLTNSIRHQRREKLRISQKTIQVKIRKLTLFGQRRKNGQARRVRKLYDVRVVLFVNSTIYFVNVTTFWIYNNKFKNSFFVISEFRQLNRGDSGEEKDVDGSRLIAMFSALL